MDGSESYDAFRDSLNDMFVEINTLQNTVLEFTGPDGTHHKVCLGFLLTGDNKFLHICQGIDKANALYFCTLCTCRHW